MDLKIGLKMGFHARFVFCSAPLNVPFPLLSSFSQTDLLKTDCYKLF